MDNEIVLQQGMTPADHTRYEIVIRNRETGQEHVFRADHHEIHWERGRNLDLNGNLISFTGKERMTIKAWRGVRSWSQFQPHEFPLGQVMDSPFGLD